MYCYSLHLFDVLVKLDEALMVAVSVVDEVIFGVLVVDKTRQDKPNTHFLFLS